MKKYPARLVAFAALALSALPALRAEVTLPRILSSGMVVQHDRPLTLWGKADPGETVSARVLRGKPVSTVADINGDWRIELPALHPGGPYTITINDLKLTDVLSGDVILCSGQSNMQLPVYRVDDMFLDETSSFSNNALRQFIVPNEVEFHSPRTDLSQGSWIPTTPESSRNFSALGYFLAKEIYSYTGMPVGIINASWGGTPIESWIAEEYLQDFPRALAEKKILEDDGYRDRIKQLESENYVHWNAVLWGSDPGMQASVKWMDPALDDSDWERVDIFDDSWKTRNGLPLVGSHWWRREIFLPDADAGKEATLRLGCIVDADSVWVNGTFVGNVTYQYPPRIYHVPAGVLRAGRNNITVRMVSNGNMPEFVPEKPYKLIVGDHQYSLEGKWAHRVGAPMPNGPAMAFYCYTPVVLYNSMINPVINYPVEAAVWYQGESNVSRRFEYPALMKQLTSCWRDRSGNPDMPFYIVELANYLPESNAVERNAWAEMRQMQAKGCDEIEGATLVPNYDLGEWNDIHPLNKKELARRIAELMFPPQAPILRTGARPAQPQRPLIKR